MKTFEDNNPWCVNSVQPWLLRNRLVWSSHTLLAQCSVTVDISQPSIFVGSCIADFSSKLQELLVSTEENKLEQLNYWLIKVVKFDKNLNFQEIDMREYNIL